MRRPPSPRVLMLVENNPYPQDPRVRREARTLVAAGYQVSVIAPAGQGQPRRELVDGVRVYRYPEPPSGNGLLGYLWEYGYSTVAILLLSLIVLLREGFDVVHAANPPDTLVFVAALHKLLGKKFVYDHHDLAPEMYFARFDGAGSPLIYRALVLLERLSCRLADRVITTNESYKTVEMERGGIAGERITVVRNGPDLSPSGLPKPDPVLRQRGKTIIGFAGAMGSQDGVDRLLRALHHLRHDLGRSDFFCFMIGGRGDALGRLRALATRMGLDEHVCFTGWVSDYDWGRYLASTEICVAPDPSNSFTNRSTMIKVAEYMAAGKPIVAFDLPEHRVTAGDAVLYVRPNDELELARALAELMDDSARRRAMGSFGRRRFETELAWQYSAPHLLEVYRKLLAQSHDEPNRVERGAA